MLKEYKSMTQEEMYTLVHEIYIEWCMEIAREKYPDALIIRLPGLFGKNIKKNFIYDYINVIPFMLKESKFRELSEKDSDLKKYYSLQDNGFYKVAVSEQDRELL